MSEAFPTVGSGRRPFVLLTNDDGVTAPGLYALKGALERFADVVVVAPEHNWSASGHSKTMHKPLRVQDARLPDGDTALVCSGSPSDCVALVLLGLLELRRPQGPPRPDLVVSGVNLGANIAQDITYSGTVAAAIEGVIGGISAIAVSLDMYDTVPAAMDLDYGAAAEFAAGLAERLLRQLPDPPLLLNTNVPALPAERIRGVQVTRLGSRLYRDVLVERTDPRGRSYYWIGGEPPAGVPQEGTDVGALAEGYVSVTPLLLDLTDYAMIPVLREWNLRFPEGTDQVTVEEWAIVQSRRTGTPAVMGWADRAIRKRQAAQGEAITTTTAGAGAR